MKTETKKVLDELCERYPMLAVSEKEVEGAFHLLNRAVQSGNKILVCGNGGSAADSEHIVGELLKCFKKKRSIRREVYTALSDFGEEGRKLQGVLEGSIRAVSLTSHLSLSTAYANDREPSAVFAQQLYGLADKGDVLITISTSGNSENCVLAAVVAKAMGVSVLALTGKEESRLSALADCAVRVPETETFKIQELHLPVYHALCAMLEEENF